MFFFFMFLAVVNVCFVLMLRVLFIISTFGGNPLASAIAVASLDVLREEGLAERYLFCCLHWLVSAMRKVDC